MRFACLCFAVALFACAQRETTVTTPPPVTVEVRATGAPVTVAPHAPVVAPAQSATPNARTPCFLRPDRGPCREPGTVEAAAELAALRARIVDAVPGTFAAIERDDVDAFEDARRTRADDWAHALLLDLGTETMLCVRDSDASICVVVQLAGLRLARTPPRTRDASALGALLGREGFDLWVESNAEAALLSYRVAAPSITLAHARAAPADTPWWWPARPDARLDAARVVPMRAPTAQEAAFAAEWDTALDGARVREARFPGGVLCLIGRRTPDQSSSDPFYALLGGFVRSTDGATRMIEITAGASSTLVAHDVLELDSSTSGAVVLGFSLTVVALVNGWGDDMREELFATLVPSEQGALRFGPDVLIAHEVVLYEQGDERSTPWEGSMRALTRCGDACLALGPRRAFTGTFRRQRFVAREERGDTREGAAAYTVDPSTLRGASTLR